MFAGVTLVIDAGDNTLRLQESAEQDRDLFEVERLVGHILCPDTHELWLGVRCVGCDEDADTRLSISQLLTDVSALVMVYLRDNRDEFPECAAALARLE